MLPTMISRCSSRSLATTRPACGNSLRKTIEQSATPAPSSSTRASVSIVCLSSIAKYSHSAVAPSQTREPSDTPTRSSTTNASPPNTNDRSDGDAATKRSLLALYKSANKFVITMPELPEVETFVRALRKPLIGRKVIKFVTDYERQIKTPSPAEFAQKVCGQKIVSIERRAKYIVIGMVRQFLVVHLRMSGHLFVEPTSSTEISKYVHGCFTLDNDTELRFRDVRKFGTFHLVDTTDELFAHIGPEPLAPEFTGAALKALLADKSTKIKPLLLDMRFVAGVGNIYADEALHYAGIHPEKIAHKISDDEASRLRDGIVAVLNKGIEREGASIRSYAKPDGSQGDMQNHVAVYGRTGEPCRRCPTSRIQRLVVAQRSAHFCPKCQKK